MGLEFTELVMEIEKKFELSINESEVYHAYTVGKLAEVVYLRLRKDEQDPCPTQKGFYKLRQHLISEYNLSRNQITLDTKLDEIIPKRKRRKSWKSLAKTLTSDPNNLELELNLWPNILFVYFCPLLVTIAMLYFMPWEFFWLAIVAAISTALFFMWLVTPLKNKIPDKFSMVKDLIPYVTTSSVIVWEQEEVYIEIKELIVKLFDIKPSQITPSSHFVDDLGLE